jgi:Zn-dependent peptidase ImmA (M78 family)
MDLPAIKRLAQDITARYNPEGLVPFPFEWLTKGIGDLDVLYSGTVTEDISGAIFLQDNRFTILINTVKSDERQYFTVAHELGHYFIHKQWLLDNRSSGFVDYSETLDSQSMLLRPDVPESMPEVDLQKEREANNFAAELLMPEDKVRELWKLTQSISACANAFQVSKIAMAVRLERLKLL